MIETWLGVNHFFFFSSRRRHTRYWRDWSSDVCSSDLAVYALKRGEVRKTPVKIGDSWVVAGALKRTDADPAEFGRQRAELAERALDERRRSEERRVGKECRSRWSPYH